MSIVQAYDESCCLIIILWKDYRKIGKKTSNIPYINEFNKNLNFKRMIDGILYIRENIATKFQDIDLIKMLKGKSLHETIFWKDYRKKKKESWNIVDGILHIEKIS